MTDFYQSPFSVRYASREMQRIFSERNKFTTWRRLWVALAESEQSLGLPISDEQLDELRAHVEEVRRNLVTVVATLADSTGKVCTEATCTYFVFSHEKAQEMGFTGLAMADEDLTEAEVLARMGLTAAAKG